MVMNSTLKSEIYSCLFLVLFLSIGVHHCFPQSPGVRNGHSMVYYSTSKSIILFGGADDSKVNRDTWSFSNSKWEKVTDGGPSPRTFPCMVTADNYILLFGGNSVLFGSDKNPVHYLDDTWKFQNGSWKKVEVNIHPPARAEAAIAYDPIRKKVVLFGGREAGDKWVLDDTWEFDGSEWNQIFSKGPTGRSGAVMVYDSRRKQIVLFGGNPVIAKEKDYNGVMWSWDGNNWSPMNSDVPLIFNSCMAYNTKENFILRFGGWTGEKRVNDTWIYKDHEWKKLHLKITPPPRNHSIMIYNSDEESFFLYGGHDGENVFGDMWIFKNKKWKLLFTEPPRRRVENGH
jgi:hypothetical protein